MKKIVVIVLISGFLMFSNFAYAYTPYYSENAKWTVGFNIACVNPEETDANTAVYIGGNVSYDLTKYFAVGAECGYTSWSVSSFNDTDYGDISGTPLLADFILKKPIESSYHTIVPYGLLGIGVTMWDFEESSILSDNNITVDADTAFSMKIAFGLDYYLTTNIALNFEGGYTWSDTVFSVAPPVASPVLATEFEGDMWRGGAGLKFRF